MDHSENSNEHPNMTVLSIDGWRAGIRFSSCHFIPKHEKCSRMHGHTYVVHLRIKGYPDDSGFLMDFSIIKRTLKEIADELDHRVLLPGRNPNISVNVEGGEVEAVHQGKRYVIPEEDVVILDLISLTAEILSEYVVNEFVKRASLPENIVTVEAGVDEGPGQGAWSTVHIR